MDTPARGTRPRNRRAVTLEAATQLFYRRGYAEIGMSDIAAATNVGASAIYRHFPSKAEILIAAIRSELAPFTQILSLTDLHGDDPASHLETIIRRLAECALDHRELGVLWQREARNLDAEKLRGLREELRASNNLFAVSVLAARPELDPARADILAWCAMGVLVSVGFHSLTLPRQQFVDLLADMVTTVITMPMLGDEAPLPSAQARRRVADTTRRDSLISQATELFAERGFSAVGVDDIAAAAGIAGPSIYSHFAGKQDILVAAIQRANALLRSDTAEVLAGNDAAPVKLAQLIDSYVRVANRDRFVIRTLLSEMDQLPPEARTLARRDQRLYIETWVDLLREFEDVDATPARIRVQAVLLVVNDAVQTPHLRTRPDFERTLHRLAGALLGLDPA